MKKILTSLFLLQSLITLGQDTTFYDNDWNKVKAIQHATYYQIVLGNQADTNRATEKVYFRSGQIKRQVDFSVYKDRKQDGKFKEWFESGQIRKDIDYKEDKKNGQLLTYWENGKLKRVDKYKDDKLIEGKCMNSDGTETTHFEYQIAPEFPGGRNKLFQYLGKEMKYPKQSRKNKDEGLVLVNFIVNKDGEISNIKIVQSVTAELAEEALRIVKEMPRWEPGMEDGEAVKVSYVLPIRVRLI
ncbi:TonB family protein [Flavihumibacter sp. R14]|nr:TonB family protein [Flavihumibacter soli]